MNSETFSKMRTDINCGGVCHGKEWNKMKNIFKKLIITVCAMSVTFTVAATGVFATMTPRSGPNDNSSVTDTVKSDDSKSKTTSASKTSTQTTDNVTSQAANQNVTAKKYLTKWGGFFWFLLSVIVNFILSCWISNRFYRLAKRNTQGSAEIRALRKDIEEKFASTLTDINEPATEIINRNENYARTDEGMEMPEHRQSVKIKEDEREILGKWDKQRTALKEENDNEHSFEMRRPMAGIKFEDEEDENESIPSRSKIDSISKAGNKAKDFLSNIFPFED